MRLILTQILSVHWLLTFALISAAALGAGGDIAEFARFITPLTPIHLPAGLPFYSHLACAAAGIASATVAAMFLWTLLMIWLGEHDEAGDAEAVAVAAHGAAMMTVSLSMLLLASTVMTAALLPAVIMIAGLSASYAAMSFEWRGEGRAAAAPDLGQAAARMMALGAAHSSVLSNLSSRGGSE